MVFIYLLVLILNKVEVLDEILERFVEIGISGATIIDSTGMGRTLICNDDIPIFGGLNKLFENCRPSNKTILSVVKREDTLQKAIKVVDEEVGDMHKSGAGILFTIPIDSAIGLSTNDVS